MPPHTAAAADAALRDVIVRYWGYRTLRPLQEPAMRAVLEGRDSLVVLPTGGGKSLCYQAPAVVRGETTVVAYTTDIPAFGNAWGQPFLLGPGTIHVAHTLEERVPKRQLLEAVEIYQRMVQELWKRE